MQNFHPLDNAQKTRRRLGRLFAASCLIVGFSCTVYLPPEDPSGLMEAWLRVLRGAPLLPAAVA